MRFSVLYVDPQWSYKVYSQKGQGRSAENHYHTMSAEDIFNLDVAGIADKDCVLFLWVTFPCLLEGLKAIERWGFTYKTLGFCWVKRCKKQQKNGFGDLAFGREPTPNCA